MFVINFFEKSVFVNGGGLLGGGLLLNKSIFKYYYYSKFLYWIYRYKCRKLINITIWYIIIKFCLILKAKNGH